MKLNKQQEIKPFLFDTIQDWAKINMGPISGYGCQKLDEINTKEKLKSEYLQGWEVEVKTGKYWVWP